MGANVDAQWGSGTLYSVIADPIGITDYNRYHVFFQLSSGFNSSLYPNSPKAKRRSLILPSDLTLGGNVCWTCQLKIYPNTTYGFAWNSSVNPEENNNAFVDALRWFRNAYSSDNRCSVSKGTYKVVNLLVYLPKIILSVYGHFQSIFVSYDFHTQCFLYHILSKRNVIKTLEYRNSKFSNWYIYFTQLVEIEEGERIEWSP